MVNYHTYRLDNGLAVITHEATDTPMATVNILYNVGARNEDASRTGFAHLFEHLMFGGTARYPDMDSVLSALGGESNASTNNDFTNYYITLPAGSLATALDIEADRMQHLDISSETLSVQQKVVTEEYNQRYKNQPYGDEWLLLRPICYDKHPYRWATIGADIRHVSEATLDDVRQFHSKHYRPDNAVLAIAAPLPHDRQLQLVEEAFRSKAVEEGYTIDLPHPAVDEGNIFHRGKRREVERHVPASKIVMAYPMCRRMDEEFRACDLISDILGNGPSSRMQTTLVRERRLFTNIDTFVTGDEGPGLFVITATMAPNISNTEAQEGIMEQLHELMSHGTSEQELGKVLNKFETNHHLTLYKAADRAFQLCYASWLGKTELINEETAIYRQMGCDEIQKTANMLFEQECNTLIYTPTKE